jgi:uncharacterized membrane protein
MLTVALALVSALSALPAMAATYHLVDLGLDSTAQDINRKGEVAGKSPDKHAGGFVNDGWETRRDRHHGSEATTVDNAGNLAGYEYDGQRGMHAMYYPRGGKGYRIPLPGGGEYGSDVVLSPDGRNVVGTFWDAEDHSHCFSWHPGDAVATDIGLPPGGYTSCSVTDVNDAGEITGLVANSLTGFIYKDAQFQLLDSFSLASLNKKGHAAGTNENSEAVFWNGKRAIVIPPTDSLEMVIGNAINDQDDIVGYGYTTASTISPLLYTGGTLVELVPLIDNAEDWSFSGAVPRVTGINDRGEITGNAYHREADGSERFHGYILQPNE